MCGYCCGGTPAEKRGEGHKDCGPTCHNSPTKRIRRRADYLAGPYSALNLPEVQTIVRALNFAVDEGII